MSTLAELLRTHSLKFGEFVLASGATSDFYLDVRRTALTGRGAHVIGREAFQLIQEVCGDVAGCGGMTLGADPIITAICIAADLQEAEFGGVIVRKAAKGHGTESWLEIAGNLSASDEIVAVDDVVTTAGSTIQAIEKLRAHGFTVRHAVCVVDREAGGRQALAEIGVELHSLMRISELL